MERNQSKILAYYKQCFNRVKLEISQKEKEICNLLLHMSYCAYYNRVLPNSYEKDKFEKLHLELLELHFEFFKLRDKYFDVKGKEGFKYE